MQTVQEKQTESAAEAGPKALERVQAETYFFELSLDWIVLRVSENVHRALGHRHVALINEPLGRFVHSEALHDLRNLFSRLSGMTRIARAYRIRLTDDPDAFDIAFQQVDGRVVLEAVPSPVEGFGEAFGTVAGLAASLAGSSGQSLLDGGVRRMRALTGYDRVSLRIGDRHAESSRGAFPAPAQALDDLPVIFTDSPYAGVPIFPLEVEESSASAALMRSPDDRQIAQLREQGVHASLRVPFTAVGEAGEFRCDSRKARSPHFELHAAAELFAQLFALRLEIDGLKKD